MSYSKYLKYKKMVKAKNQNTITLHKDSIQKIKNHKDTKRISVDDFREAFEYVNTLFPNANVMDAEVYVAKRAFLDKIGYKGIGGFYSKVEKIIVIPDKMPIPDITPRTNRWKTIQANLTPEEILVHELCHYVSGKTCVNDRSMQLEEEFAYGNMIGFCRKKGRSDEQIIGEIFMPYLASIVLREKADIQPVNDELDKILFEFVIKKSVKLGENIIYIWDKKNGNIQETIVNDRKKVIHLDLDD